MPIFDYRCPGGHVTSHLHRDHVLDPESDTWVDRAKPDALPCARCGATALPTVTAPTFRLALGRHVDRSIGKEFANEREADRYAREHGLSEKLTPDDSDVVSRQLAKMRAEAAQEDAAFAEQQKEWRESPAFAWHRENTDKGVYIDDAQRRLQENGVYVPKEQIEIGA